jgi:hypothetical protein
MNFVIDSPFTPPIAAAAVAAIVCAALLYFARSAIIGALAAGLVFLASYYETYQKIPDFPPAGAANKMFYIAGAVAVVAAALAWFSPNRLARALAASLFAAAWTGASQFAQADAIWFVTFVAMVLGGGAVLYRLDDIAFSREGAVNSAATLAASASTFLLMAPIALFGGSSTSVGLMLGASAGLALLSLAALSGPVGATKVSILGAGAGLLALADSLTLISRRADLIAVALMAVAPFLTPLGLRLLPARPRDRPALIWLASGLAALSPLPVILALLFWRHESPL